MVEIVIAVVGKPSVGKSTFFNAVNDTKLAKTGNYPFTTIEPNTGISYYRIPCPCQKYLEKDKSDANGDILTTKQKNFTCSPRHGKCEAGVRFLPIKLLDIAGLVPGASNGEGLGNKFLDDLRHAQILIHILDVSGRTNAKGEQTEGYNPIDDATWLEDEIHQWVFNNLWERWDNIVRKHISLKANLLETLGRQLSGYGCNSSHISNIIDKLPVSMKESNLTNSSASSGLSHWTESDVHALVNVFMEVRFPTILLLNKADVSSSDTDTNIQNILEKYHSSRCFIGSAAAECFLNLAREKKLISYKSGDTMFQTIDDIKDDIEFRRLRGETISDDEEKAIIENSSCNIIKDEKIARRLNRIKNMILYRYSGTGVWSAIQAAIEILNPVVIFPVQSFGCIISQSSLTENISSQVSQSKEEPRLDNVTHGLQKVDINKERKKEGPNQPDTSKNDSPSSKSNADNKDIAQHDEDFEEQEEQNDSQSLSTKRQRPLFEDAVILKSGTTVKNAAQTYGCSGENLLYAELLKDGNVKQKVGKDYLLSGHDNIIRFTFSKVPVVLSTSGSSTNTSSK